MAGLGALSPKGAGGRQAAGSGLGDQLRAVGEGCTECGACVRQCGFLGDFGTPKAVADRYDPADRSHLAMPFECSLCGLCTAVCPEGLDPGELFLEMRREAVRRGAGELAEHRGVLTYERRGSSKRYSYYALPEGCSTVFFPGCTFAGTRAGKVLQVFSLLREAEPRLGIVLDCCGKPSHDLGRDDAFGTLFGELRDYLLGVGVRRVLVACPNCFQVFRRYGAGLQVRSVYEVLASAPLPRERALQGTVTVHDPCVVRFEPDIQGAVRRLLERVGLEVEEMTSAGRRTLCCGEGGAVGCLSPERAETWRERRAEQAAGRRVVTYCAGCADRLSRRGPASHVLDLVFEPEAALAGKARVARAPFTYLSRLWLKRRLRRSVEAAVTRERPAAVRPRAGAKAFLKPLLLVAFLVAAVVSVRATGAARYLDQETLRGLIRGYGALAPLAYILLYTVAPPLFLPGLPITIAGGVLFGPLWGVVYTVIGSNLGANLAFLISRYLARDWVEARLVSPRWRKLDRQVAEQGWKVVAVTRLVPLFPFNLLNYAFGLTRIPLAQYALATLLCMLPACVAYIVFSSSLLDLIRGRVSPAFLLGAALVVAVSLVPVLHRKLRGSPGRRRERAQAEPGAYSGRRSLRNKGLLMAGLAGVGVATVALIRHYFYLLDAYVYTWEFHYLFWVHNLGTGDLAKFTEYLAAMAPAGQGGVMLVLASLVRVFRLPLSEPLLAEAARQAYGVAAGGLAAYAGGVAAAFAAFAAGWFLLGDVLPVTDRGRGDRGAKGPSALLPAVALALPWVPVLVAGLLAGLLRPGLRRALVLVAAGIAIRVLWLLVTPGLFLG